jgi:hypothetical protein
MVGSYEVGPFKLMIRPPILIPRSNPLEKLKVKYDICDYGFTLGIVKEDPGQRGRCLALAHILASMNNKMSCP